MKNIILIGMPGCGKTTLGQKIAAKLGLLFFDCDVEITKIQGVSIPQIFDKYGEKYFRGLETELIKTHLPKENCVISTGGGIVEATENIDILRANGTVIFVNRPVKNIAKDIDTAERPLLKDGKDKLAKLFDRRITLYKSACHIEVQNTGEFNDTIMKIIDEVKKNG